MPAHRLFVPAALVCATVLASCYTYDPYSNDKKVSKTTSGAGIGAAVGAVAGILTGSDSRDRRKRALIGAGVGGSYNKIGGRPEAIPHDLAHLVVEDELD